MKTYQRRIKALEMASPAFADVLKLIRQGMRYDQLDENQKNRYCALIRTPRKDFEEIVLAVFGDLHILLQKIDPPAPEELKSIVDEIEQTVFSTQAEERPESEV